MKGQNERSRYDSNSLRLSNQHLEKCLEYAFLGGSAQIIRILNLLQYYMGVTIEIYIFVEDINQNLKRFQLVQVFRAGESASSWHRR